MDIKGENEKRMIFLIKSFLILLLLVSCGNSQEDYSSQVDVARKYLNDGKYQQAESEFYVLLESYPDDALVLYGLSISILGNGVYGSDGKIISNSVKLKESILYLKKALDLFPGNFTIALTYASTLVDNKEYDEAIEIFYNYYEMIHQIETNTEAIRLRYFEALKEVGQFEHARKVLGDIKNKYPTGMNVNDPFWASMISELKLKGSEQ